VPGVKYATWEKKSGTKNRVVQYFKNIRTKKLDYLTRTVSY